MDRNDHIGEGLTISTKARNGDITKSEILMHACDLAKSYQFGAISVPVLHEVSLDVRRGEMVSIMGPSGCGKSTLLSILGLLDKPSGGTYKFAGQDTAALDDNALSILRNREIGFVFQAFHLLPTLSIVENVCVPLYYRDITDSEMRRKAVEALKRVGLDSFGRHRPGQLSGGQQQRVAIARALVGNPSVIMADEPTGALDSKTATGIMELFCELNCERSITLIYVTHDPIVADYSHRRFRVQDGRIVQGPES